jgi:hypothetical protein
MVAGADGARGTEESGTGEDASEGDEGFFFDTAGELLPAVFFVEITAFFL